MSMKSSVILQTCWCLRSNNEPGVRHPVPHSGCAAAVSWMALWVSSISRNRIMPKPRNPNAGSRKIPTTAEHAHCMDHRCSNSQQLAIPLRQVSGESRRGSASIPEKRSWTLKDFKPFPAGTRPLECTIHSVRHGDAGIGIGVKPIHCLAVISFGNNCSPDC